MLRRYALATNAPKHGGPRVGCSGGPLSQNCARFLRTACKRQAPTAVINAMRCTREVSATLTPLGTSECAGCAIIRVRCPCVVLPRSLIASPGLA